MSHQAYLKCADQHKPLEATKLLATEHTEITKVYGPLLVSSVFSGGQSWCPQWPTYASASISTSMSGSISFATCTIVAAGRMSRKTSP
jgi:hypothetical protein